MDNAFITLFSKQNLTRIESFELFSTLKQRPEAQQAALLTLLCTKKESIDEIMGVLDFIKQERISIASQQDVIDIVGTGGDKLNTFNISTAASLVVASCGVKVAKHGGRAASSASGSADVIEHLGISHETSPLRIRTQLEQDHYAFLYAPFFNPVLLSFRPLRKALGFPNLFNILGPLSNPLEPQRLVIGVYRYDLLKTIASVLLQSNVIHAYVVHAENGMDEFSICGPTHVMEVKEGTCRSFTVTPEEVGLQRASLDAIRGGTPRENAETIHAVFSQQTGGAKLDIVLLNAASGLMVAGKVKTFQEGIDLAREAITSGLTLQLLKTLQQRTCHENYR